MRLQGMLVISFNLKQSKLFPNRENLTLRVAMDHFASSFSNVKVFPVNLVPRVIIALHKTLALLCETTLEQTRVRFADLFFLKVEPCFDM